MIVYFKSFISLCHQSSGPLRRKILVIIINGICEYFVRSRGIILNADSRVFIYIYSFSCLINATVIIEYVEIDNRMIDKR
jgi:hypothetical protein